MREYKVVLLGPMGAGKSTAIRTLVGSENFVSTDVQNTEQNRSKATTTVAMDYGDLQLPNDERIRLFGTPGQERFDFLWPSLTQGATGAIILVSATDENPADKMLVYLKVLHEKNPALPVLVGITKGDLSTPLQIEQCKKQISGAGYHLPFLVCDARNKDSTFMLIDVLMSEIETQELLAQL